MNRIKFFGLLTFTPGIFATYLYYFKTFQSADEASKSFIEKINSYQINKGLQKERVRDELLILKSKMEITIKFQNILNDIFTSNEREDFIYRLEWMISSLQKFKVPEGEKLSFDKDCEINFDTIVDPKYLVNDSLELHKKLKDLLGVPQEGAIHKDLVMFKNSYMIPKDKYEAVFRKLIDEVLNLTSTIKELKTTRVSQEYVDDFSMSFEATCEPVSKGVSKMLVNIARPISYDKAQQLAAHELTHHIQFILMEELIEKFPEMKIIQDMGVLSMLLEGGAELAVDLIYDPATRKVSLRNMLPPSFSDAEVERILEIEAITWKASWANIIYISKQFLNNKINKKELEQQLEVLTFKPNNSWPNADFIEAYRAYVQSYGWGREIIARYLQSTRAYNLEGYVQFMKRPLPPSKLMRLAKVGDL